MINVFYIGQPGILGPPGDRVSLKNKDVMNECFDFVFLGFSWSFWFTRSSRS